jgi:hypothetical protein
MRRRGCSLHTLTPLLASLPPRHRRRRLHSKHEGESSRHLLHRHRHRRHRPRSKRETVRILGTHTALSHLNIKTLALALAPNATRQCSRPSPPPLSRDDGVSDTHNFSFSPSPSPQMRNGFSTPGRFQRAPLQEWSTAFPRRLIRLLPALGWVLSRGPLGPVRTFDHARVRPLNFGRSAGKGRGFFFIVPLSGINRCFCNPYSMYLETHLHPDQEKPPC